MEWTRLSFIYLISYLALGGIGLFAAPELAFRLLGSSANYSAVLGRFMGAFMIALAVIVFQIRRHRIEVLYSTTLVVRTILLGTILWLFFESRDPMFLALTGIVGFGLVLTSIGLVTDRRGSARVAS